MNYDPLLLTPMLLVLGIMWWDLLTSRCTLFDDVSKQKSPKSTQDTIINEQ